MSPLLTKPAPGNVSLDEQRPPKASKDPQQDERGQLHQVPRRVKLHIEEHQAAVPKRVDGAQGEGRHQSGEERTPQSLQGEVVAHLEEREADRDIYWWERGKAGTHYTSPQT